jgi:Xaa-Pro aminopeptidase
MGFPENFANDALDALSCGALVADRPDAEFVDATLLVLEARLIKTPHELEYMRAAGTYTWAGLKAALGAVRAGATDSQIAAAAHQGALDMGSELMSIDPQVCTGRRTGYMPHIAHRRTPLEAGDPVFLEVSGSHNRYNAPSMRSASVGPPNDVVRRLSDAALETLSLLIENIRPGRTGDDVAQVAKRGLEGVERLFFHGAYGYSIGLSFQPSYTENPVYISAGAERVLEPGMTFHLPICVWIPGEVGVGFSESVVVTDGGCEMLTPNLELALREA